MSTLRTSILIPTHNRHDILTRVLDSIAQVDVPQGADVEVIVVANACTDQTVAMVQQRTHAFPFTLRCVEESRANLNIARNCTVQHASGEILAFLDDDVWVDRQWLRGLQDVYRDWPADIVGGKITLWWQDVSRPDWMTDRMTNLLTWKDHGTAVHRRSSHFDAAGANFSFRRRVYDTIGPFREGLDRTGNVVLSAGESEFILRALTAGFQLFYSPHAAVQHWVAPHRVSIDYLCGVAHGNGASNVLIKPCFGLGQCCRTVVGHLYLLIAHAMAELFYRLLARRKQMVRHRLLRYVGMGGLMGVSMRLRKCAGNSRTS